MTVKLITLLSLVALVSTAVGSDLRVAVLGQAPAPGYNMDRHHFGPGGAAQGAVGVEPLSRGAALTDDEAEMVERAKKIIKEAEAACAGFLPTVPPPQAPTSGLPELLRGQGGTTESVSRVLDGTTIGRETIPKPDGSHSAASSSGGGGTYPSEGGGSEVHVDGDGINLSPEALATDAGTVAMLLVHEAAHIAFGSAPNGSQWDDHSQVLPWLINYYCVLAECMDSPFGASVADQWIAQNAALLHATSGINDACDYCSLLYTLCPYHLTFWGWLNAQSGVIAAELAMITPAQWPTYIPLPLPISISTTRTPVFYATTLSDPGNGNLFLHPESNSVELQWVPSSLMGQLFTGQNAAFNVVIPFDAALPGFQATCISLPAPGDARQFAVGGFDTATNECWLVRVQLDLGTSPCFQLTTEYKGAGTGPPIDIATTSMQPTRVAVLDSAGTVSVVNIVSDTATALQTVGQTSELEDCRYIYLLKTEASGPPTQYGIAYVLTSSDLNSSLQNPNSSYSQVEVRLLDFDFDGVIDKVAVD